MFSVPNHAPSLFYEKTSFCFFFLVFITVFFAPKWRESLFYRRNRASCAHFGEISFGRIYFFPDGIAKFMSILKQTRVPAEFYSPLFSLFKVMSLSPSFSFLSVAVPRFEIPHPNPGTPWAKGPPLSWGKLDTLTHPHARARGYLLHPLAEWLRTPQHWALPLSSPISRD